MFVTKTNQALNGYLWLMVDENQFILNKWRFNGLKQGQSEAISFLDSYLLDSISTMTIHFALFLEKLF